MMEFQSCGGQTFGGRRVHLYFCPGGQEVHWLSLAWNLNAPLMSWEREGGGGGVVLGGSNDWCIIFSIQETIELFLQIIIVYRVSSF